MKKIFIPFVVSALLIFNSCDWKDGSVRVGNNMEAYALEYIENHELLYPDEKIVSYYDYTISCDGTQAAILTDTRLIYHNQETTTSYFSLEEITKIDHYEKGLEGLFIEVWKGDELMIIEIAPWLGGEIFLKLLKKTTNL